MKIVIFTRPFINYIEWKKIEEKINSLSNVEVKLKIKPRGDLSPLHASRHFAVHRTSSELINWADLIVSHISSILIEVFIKKNQIAIDPSDARPSRFVGGERIDAAISELNMEKRKGSLSIKLLEELQNKEAVSKFSSPLSGKNLPFSSLSDKLSNKKAKK